MNTKDCESCYGGGWISDDVFDEWGDIAGQKYRYCDDCGGRGEYEVKEKN